MHAGRPRTPVGWTIWLVGAVPAKLEPADESVLDFRGDVAVGFHEPIAEMMTETACLGDFGNVISDEPGLMTVPEPVECQARPNRRGAFAVKGTPLTWDLV